MSHLALIIRLGRNVATASVLLTLASACDDDSTSPTMESVAGAYEATAFMADGQDILAEGGELTMTLASEGTVTGHLFVTEDAGGPFEADLAGTYTLSGNSVTFNQAADTFVRDASWTWSDGVLNGTWSGSGNSVTVRMVRR